MAFGQGMEMLSQRVHTALATGPPSSFLTPLLQHTCSQFRDAGEPALGLSGSSSWMTVPELCPSFSVHRTLSLFSPTVESTAL